MQSHLIGATIPAKIDLIIGQALNDAFKMWLNQSALILRKIFVLTGLNY